MLLDCVQQFCTGAPNSWGGCQVNGPGAYVSFPAQITHCCTADDPNACFGALQGSGSGSASTFSAPGACATVTSILTSCLNADAGYKTQALVDRAQCLCYNADGTYNPSRWDDAELACSSIGPGSGSGPQSNLWMAVSSDGVGWCTRNARGGAGSAAASTTASGAAASSSTTAGNGGGGSGTGTGATTSAAAAGTTASATATTAATSAGGAATGSASASATKAAAGKVVRADGSLLVGITVVLGVFVVVGLGTL